jgi:hypothetical protein
MYQQHMCITCGPGSPIMPPGPGAPCGPYTKHVRRQTQQTATLCNVLMY